MNIITDSFNTDLLKFIQSSGLGVFIVLFVLGFMRYPLWNWYTKTYYPSRIKIEQDRNSILTSLNENLLWLTYLVQRQESKLNDMEDKLTAVSVVLGTESLEDLRIRVRQKEQIIRNPSDINTKYARETSDSKDSSHAI